MDLHLAEATVQRVEEHQSTGQRLADAQDELDGLGGLQAADDARQHPQHTPFGAARHLAGWRWIWVKAAVARSTVGRVEDRQLTLEAEDAPVH